MSRLRAPLSQVALASEAAKLRLGRRTLGSMRSLVREATRNDHQRLDHAMSSLKLANRTSYSTFLTIHYKALSALAGRWSARDHADFSGLLLCLVDDLQAVECPTGRLVETHAKASSLRQWGIGYVIRGSRLGGAILRQRVPANFPASYLNFVPSLTWPDFLNQLEHEALLMYPHAHTQIIRGAKQAFGAFAGAAANAGVRE